MLELRFTAKFKKDYKCVERQSKDFSKFGRTSRRLCEETIFPMRRGTIHSVGQIAVIANVVSNLTGCSYIE